MLKQVVLGIAAFVGFALSGCGSGDDEGNRYCCAVSKLCQGFDICDRGNAQLCAAAADNNEAGCKKAYDASQFVCKEKALASCP
jgi:hypothetical protein